LHAPLPGQPEVALPLEGGLEEGEAVGGGERVVNGEEEGQGEEELVDGAAEGVPVVVGVCGGDVRLLCMLYIPWKFYQDGRNVRVKQNRSGLV